MTTTFTLRIATLMIKQIITEAQSSPRIHMSDLIEGLQGRFFINSYVCSSKHYIFTVDLDLEIKKLLK